MNRALLAGTIFLWAALSAIAEKPLADYSFIRGFLKLQRKYWTVQQSFQ